jgi:hypothetical protein
MIEYHVVWRIELYADNETEAATQARQILLDPDSEAVSFEVAEFHEYRREGDKANFVVVDLSESEGCEYCHNATFGGSCACEMEDVEAVGPDFRERD